MMTMMLLRWCDGDDVMMLWRIVFSNHWVGDNVNDDYNDDNNVIIILDNLTDNNDNNCNNNDSNM